MRVIHGRLQLDKVRVKVLELEIDEIGRLLPLSAPKQGVELKAELKSLTELLQPILKRMKRRTGGDFSRCTIGYGGRATAALAEGERLLLLTEDPEERAAVQARIEIIKAKARALATSPILEYSHAPPLRQTVRVVCRRWWRTPSATSTCAPSARAGTPPSP